MTFRVAVDFAFGQCRLKLTSGTAACTLVAHAEPNSFTDLVTAVADLAEGRRSVSVRWTSGDGSAADSFLDLALAPTGHVGIAVHDCVTVDGEWSPARGEARFLTRVSYDEVITTFAAALWRTRVRYADDFGFIEQWGWLVPRHQLDSIMTRAGLIGFAPASRREDAC
ncbi:hypothetical protein [Allokutzneria oryzae]|uniref:Uncharacterized protein n=1 Tax=Allokutzneria oryzae TaxID=1378989 RepID=A0ABV6ABX8_9PSEU